MSNDVGVKKKIDVKYVVHSAISLIIMFGFGYLPVIEPITHVGMQVLGILIGMVYEWVLVGIPWPSLLGLIALIQTGFMPASDVVKASFGEPNVVLLFLIFMLLFLSMVCQD